MCLLPEPNTHYTRPRFPQGGGDVILLPPGGCDIAPPGPRPITLHHLAPPFGCHDKFETLANKGSLTSTVSQAAVLHFSFWLRSGIGYEIAL